MAETASKNEHGERVDSLRGIQNVQTIQREFAEKKSLQARATEARWGEKDKSLQKDNNSLNDGARGVTIRSISYAEQLREKSQNEVRRKATEATIKKSGVRRLSGFARWGGLGVIGLAYFWQLVFAILSLIGFYTQANIESFQSNNWFGIAVGWFFDFSKYFPGKEAGYLFWGIAALISIMVFLGFLIWFQFMGLKAFGTLNSTAITLFLFGVNILPVGNLFPLLAIWVLYMNIKDFSTNFG